MDSWILGYMCSFSFITLIDSLVSCSHTVRMLSSVKDIMPYEYKNTNELSLMLELQ